MPATTGHAGRRNPIPAPAPHLPPAPRVVTAACTLPTAPGAVTATAGVRSATVSWTAANGAGLAITGYLVSLDTGGPAVAVGPATLTATLTGLSGGSAVTPVVSAVTSCGTGPAGTATPITPTGVSGSYPAAVLADSPAAYYRLGEAVGVTLGADSSGHGVLAQYGTGSTRATTGALGTLDPDPGVTANGGCCVATARPVLPLFDNPRSVEAWVKPSDNSGRWIAAWGRNEGETSFGVGVAGASIIVDSYNDGLTFPLSRTLSGDGSWHQVVVTATGSQVTAYVDGVPVGTKNFVNPMDTVNDSGLVIGAYENGGSPFYGGLDEVSVYPSVLSAAAVAAHFAATGFQRPAAPTRVVASDGADNEAVVSWAVAPPTTPAISRYVVTAIAADGTRSTSVVVDGTKTAARVTGLPGDASYTFAVAAGNSFGLSPETISGTATMSGPPLPYAAAVAADSPMAYYRLGDPLNARLGADSAGNGNLLEYSRTTLKLDGALPTDADTAASADGGCCIGTGHPALPSFNSPRTVEFWVRPLDDYGRWVLGWGRGETDLGFNVGIGDSAILVSGWGDDLTFPVQKALRDGAYHYVAASYDGTAVTAYLDGVAVGTKAFAHPLDTVNDSGLVVGAALNGGSPYYGSLDEIAVYGSALSAEQIGTHFAATGHAVPTAVSDLTVDAGANSATVSWTPPDTGNDPLTGYLVSASADGVRMDSTTVAPDASTATLTGLPAGVAVTLSVAALDAYGAGVAVDTDPVTPTGSATTYPGAIAADVPSLYYRLGEASGLPVAANSAPDGPALQIRRAGYGAAGALVGDPNTAATVDGGCCLSAVPTTLPAFNDARTVEAWVKPLDGYGRWVLGWGDTVTDRSFNLGVQDSLVLVSAWGDDLTFQAPRSLVDGFWHHVAVTYDGSLARVYLDSVLLGTKSFVNALDTADVATLRVGSHANGGSPFYGGIDEVAVYPAALSGAQLAAHFAASGHGVPAGVTGLTATAGANAITASWTATPSPDPINSYVVTAYRAGSTPVNAVAVAPTATSAVISGLLGGTAYTVKVVASNTYGTGTAATSASVTPTGSTASYAGSVLANAPSAYYRLGDGTGSKVAADSSGRGHPGTYNQAVVGGASALRSDPDTSARANGGCCIAAAVSALPSGNASRSVEAWVKPLDGYGRWFAGWGASSTRLAFNVGVQDSYILVGSYGDDLSFQTGRSLVDGIWHHVVATYNGTTVSAYLDNRLIGTKNFASTLHTTTAAQLQIGSGNNGGSPYYGDLDELAIYPTALTAAQVSAHFGASGHAIPTAAGAVSASPAPNALSVSWTSASSPDGVTGYLLTAMAGSTPRNSVVVAGSATSGTITGLPSGVAYSARVVALNAYGRGPAGTAAAVTPTGSATTYPGTVLAANPVAYYRLGDTGGTTSLADSSVTGNLAANNRGTFGQAGAIAGDADRAVDLDAGCCLGASASAVPVFNSARTVEAWVKPRDTYLRWILGWGTAATDRSFNVGTTNDALMVSGYADDLTFPTGKSLEDGAWHHLVATYDGSTVAAYVDGVSLGSRTFHAALNTVSSGLFRIGSAMDGSTPYYGGLDEIAVYPTALSASEVAGHFAASGHAVPGTPSAVTATARANGVDVSWTAPAAGNDPIGEFLITAYQGSTPVNSLAVPGTRTSATLTGLPGGVPVTVRVTGGNLYGFGNGADSAAVTPTGAASTYASTVLADAPVAYYRLGEPAATPVGGESSGRAGPLTYTATATRGVTGALASDPDTGLTNNGGCCVGSAQAPQLPEFNGSRTVEAWVKPLDAASRWFAGWGTNSTDRVFDVGVAGSSVIVAGYADDLTFPIGRSLVDGSWHHIAVSYDGSAATAYVDGVSIGSKSFLRSLNTVTNGFLRIGAAVDGGAPTYGGLDEVAIYPTALTAAQISAHYAAR
ncbi:LamG-like jellyroll fold domain-containing protein [Jatrophihabitans sp.]|uniref:LamG-like jellyroll fold domain-containing protein n=1 Tax=Jatrophihabitans sp. TaxID=1932789 RepID=UPI002B6B8A26|nr:LamG-like jellyroll fold domain-containing protein [Jatrophihabitans sp.]